MYESDRKQNCIKLNGKGGRIDVCKAQTEDMTPRSIALFPENGKPEYHGTAQELIKSLEKKGVRQKELVEANMFAKGYFRSAKETNTEIGMDSPLLGLKSKDKKIV